MVKRLRVINENDLGLKRKYRTKEPKGKYYIIPEGDSTEPRYFHGFEAYYSRLLNNKLLEVLIVENEDKE